MEGVAMTFNGGRLPKRGRWRLEVPDLQPLGVGALTCAGIVTVCALLLTGWIPGVIESLARTGALPYALGLPLLGVARYSWPNVGQNEGNISGGRASDEMRAAFGLHTYSMP